MLTAPQGGQGNKQVEDRVGMKAGNEGEASTSQGAPKMASKPPARREA